MSVGRRSDDPRGDSQPIGVSERDPNHTTCDRCHGARVVHPRTPKGKPDYANVIPCKACNGFGYFVRDPQIPLPDAATIPDRSRACIS